MNSSEVRKTFLDFFKEKNHELVKSSSLIPQNDSTLLFTNAGMIQFKDVSLVQKKLLSKELLHLKNVLGLVENIMIWRMLDTP